MIAHLPSIVILMVAVMFLLPRLSKASPLATAFWLLRSRVAVAYRPDL
jgi:hypothetical protein